MSTTAACTVAKVKGVIQGVVRLIARLTYRQRYEQRTGRSTLRGGRISIAFGPAGAGRKQRGKYVGQPVLPGCRRNAHLQEGHTWVPIPEQHPAI